MKNLSFSKKVQLYLYSTPHIVGCLLGVAGLGLFGAGFIDKGWALIVAGLYGAGALLTPHTRATADLAEVLSEDSLLDDLQALIRSNAKQLPSEALRLLDSIRSHVEALIPNLANLTAAGKLDPDTRHTVMATVTRYLPETLGHYVRLPPAYAKLHTDAQGKTAQMLLLDQLNTLDRQLGLVLETTYRQDAEALANHGRFLAGKFQSSSFLT